MHAFASGLQAVAGVHPVGARVGGGMFSVKQVLAAVLALVCLGGEAAAEPASAARPDPAAIRPDPAVRRGVLPNGLRYAVMRNATPRGGVSLRLAVDAGSLQERDDERGLAHFVEHMAFNGTRHFPEDGLEGVFAPLGVAFGRDHNATTNTTTTLYSLDLKGAGAEQLAPAFLWLRDVADGLLFAPDAVRRERGVVLAEREARSSPDAEASDALAVFRGRGLREPDRAPIGTIESVSSATPQRLQAFYDRWYRPENAAVVVVGDAPIEELERRIVEGFGGWKGRGPVGFRPPMGAPDASRGLEVLALADPRLTPEVAACRVRGPDPDGPDDIERLRRNVRRVVWRGVLQRRLDRLSAGASASVLAAGISTEDSAEAQTTCVSALPTAGQWAPAVTALQAEIHSLASAPPSEAELEDVVMELRAFAVGAVTGAATRGGSDLAGDIVQALLAGDVIATPQEEMRAVNVALEDLSPAAAKAAFEADWAGAGPLVSVIVPQALEDAVVKAAWSASAAGLAPDAPARSDPTWRYAPAGAPGRVVAREVVKAPGFVRVRFANGLVLNLKQTAFAKGEIRLRATFGAGRREIAERDWIAAGLGAQLLARGGLGKNSYDEIEAMMRRHEWGLELEMQDDAFVMDGKAMPGSLQGELALLAAYFTDPGFRPVMEVWAAGMVDILYQGFENDPQTALGRAMDAALSPGHAERTPSRAELAALKAQDFARLLKPALTQAPIVLTLVGDFDEATAIGAVARTLGALPPRAQRDRARPDAAPIRYVVPVSQAPPVRAYHQGPSDKAAVSVQWPLYVGSPARRRETYALTLAGWVLEDQLRVRIREQLGKTYAPRAGVALPDDGDQGLLTATVETAPADVVLALGEIGSAAAELAAGKITAQMLETVRRPVLKDMEGERLANAWWLAVLELSNRDPAQMRNYLDARAVLAAITLDEVRKAAADWLSRPAATGVSIPVARQAANAQGGAR